MPIGIDADLLEDLLLLSGHYTLPKIPQLSLELGPLSMEPLLRGRDVSLQLLPRSGELNDVQDAQTGHLGSEPLQLLCLLPGNVTCPEQRYLPLPFGGDVRRIRLSRYRCSSTGG
jgi:hypothetical protein